MVRVGAHSRRGSVVVVLRLLNDNRGERELRKTGEFEGDLGGGFPTKTQVV